MCLAQVNIEYTYGQLCIYTQGRPGEIHTPAHWNLINQSMTTPSSVLWPNSTLPPPSLHFSFQQGKFECAFEKCSYFIFLSV